MKTYSQRKLLLDSNIYGEMAIDKEIENLKRNYEAYKEKIIVYGIREIIRRELRATPKSTLLGGRNLRIALVSLYDYFVGSHELNFNKPKSEKTADEYYKFYRFVGGSKQKDDLINDFMIVACASLNNLDIVVSNDDTTMLAENAAKAYRNVNAKLRLRTPGFIGYSEFKKMIIGDAQWNS